MVRCTNIYCMYYFEVVLILFDFRYVRQNLSSAEEARNYAENIPGFLVNRPGSVVKHCYKRWDDSANISVDDIDQIGEGQFLVKSQTPGCSQVYTVNFSPGDFPIPCCSCDDWRKHHLICKHFCAIFRHTPWKWEQLPEEYRNNPFITLDDDVLHHFCSPTDEETTRNSEPFQEYESSMKESQPLPVPSKSRMSKLRSKILGICEVIKSHVYSCKDEVRLEEFYNKLQNTAETLRDVSCEKNEFLVDEEKDMTHIGTPKARRLSLSNKRRKGTGRHGLAADKLKTYSSKGIGDLLQRESGMFMYIFKIQYMLHVFCVIAKFSDHFLLLIIDVHLFDLFYLFTDDCKVIEEEVITIDDNDQCVINTSKIYCLFISFALCMLQIGIHLIYSNS